MNNLFSNFISIILLFFITNSCKHKKSYISIKLPQCDTILNLDTPILKKENVFDGPDRINPTYTIVQEDVKALGLRVYDKGYDSIAIRLFYNYSGPEADIIEIRKHCEGWIAELIKIKRRTEKEKVIIDIVERKPLFPESEWKDFTKKILNLGITTLPDCFEIPNYNHASDGSSITIEISTAKYYRVYYYLNPITKPHIEEAKKIEEIMDVIEQEFGIKRKTKI